VSANRDDERVTGTGTSADTSEAGRSTETPGGSSGVIGGGEGAVGAMGGGGGMGGTTGAGLGGREGVITADIGDTETSERGAGTGGDITNSIGDTTDRS
jgi:hypothetical protein